MNFDYRGTIVQKSTPTPELRTVKKVLHIDSADRDTGIYYTNGEFVVYLPRVYEKVISLRLMSAEFPSLDLAWSHSYTNGSNVSGATYSSDVAVNTSSATNYIPNYFLVDIEGLNKSDETAVAGNRSQYPDSFFAKIANTVYTKSSVSNAIATTGFIEYNDHSGMENVAHFSPPIGKLDLMYFQWLDNGGTQINNVDCEWSATMNVTENKPIATVASTLPALPPMNFVRK